MGPKRMIGLFADQEYFGFLAIGVTRNNGGDCNKKSKQDSGDAIRIAEGLAQSALLKKRLKFESVGH